MLPATGLQKDAGQIVDMKSLHDKHDRTFGWIVEARH
jgi:hypothetical protein